MGAAARLADLGLELPEVALPLAAYVPAVRSGAYVYTSGQLPLVAGALPATGKVGVGDGLVSPDDAAGYARTCALNALAAVAAVVAAEGGPQGAHALDNRMDFGVWGGMTERERRALLRRRPEVRSWRNELVGSDVVVAL